MSKDQKFNPDLELTNNLDRVAKHAPGPWEIQHYTNHVGFSVWAKDRGCIAERWYNRPQEDLCGSEIEGNAHLIAAAPAMLNLLKEIEAYLCFRSELDAKNLRAMKESIEAAIARAEGK